MNDEDKSLDEARLMHRIQTVVLEHQPAAVFVIDDKRIMKYVNSALEILFGYSRNELLGQPVEMLMPDAFRSQHIKDAGQFLGGAGEAVKAMASGRRVPAMHKNGTEREVEIQLARKPMDGGIYGIANIWEVRK